MFQAVITNKGLALLESGQAAPVADALALIREAHVEGETPAEVARAFASAAAALLADPTTCWRQLTREVLIKVREPLPPGEIPVAVLSDPPITHYRGRHGGPRPGAGARPQRADGRLRVHVSATLDPDLHKAVKAQAAARGVTYSETVAQLLREALAGAPASR